MKKGSQLKNKVVHLDLSNKTHREILKKLSSDTSIKVFVALLGEYKRIKDLADELGMDYHTVLYHVKKFSELGVVKQSMFSKFKKDLREKYIRIELPMDEIITLDIGLSFIFAGIVCLIVATAEFGGINSFLGGVAVTLFIIGGFWICKILFWRLRTFYIRVDLKTEHEED